MIKDKITLITGAASGIGYAVAREFARGGAKVILTDKNKEDVQKAAQKLREEGCAAWGFQCDVTKEEEIKHTIEDTVDRLGRLDVLINNAGMQHVASIEEFPKETFEQLLSIMLTAPFLGIKYAFPFMKKQKFGRIINMASINGVIGFQGKAGYNSAKHGVIGLTKVAALEGANHGITVNALCPGYVDTPLVRNQMEDLARNRGVEVEKVLEEVIYPLVPQNRLIEVEEIADYMMFLASAKAKGVTGQAVLLDGGYTAQ
ncbi:3-hydroxybutyrate dehydrogenase [Virgibacillus alimentarius]|uniref:3-hydroxybutyrate dehydrogenase n=1 Tax=Virgibacillus alimentarius TaxID=698769 RepID=A0ABS4SBU4_9BACI|nr:MULTISPECIES: 3-hydroxybutyrate dehydrogenase [Virgibacillus]MBP2258983.1 3-hydroxybutyrate dehydrogenase [Virgibacillus alimentarius]HLR68132.1 3-hydroxybutyrate dehydrogenase [Virgibacillus sp.]